MDAITAQKQSKTFSKKIFQKNPSTFRRIVLPVQSLQYNLTEDSCRPGDPADLQTRFGVGIGGWGWELGV